MGDFQMSFTYKIHFKPNSKQDHKIFLGGEGIRSILRE